MKIKRCWKVQPCSWLMQHCRSRASTISIPKSSLNDSICFPSKPVLYKHSPIVWWLKMGMDRVCLINAMAETTRNTLNHLPSAVQWNVDYPNTNYPNVWLSECQIDCPTRAFCQLVYTLLEQFIALYINVWMFDLHTFRLSTHPSPHISSDNQGSAVFILRPHLSATFMYCESVAVFKVFLVVQAMAFICQTQSMPIFIHQTIGE